MATDGASAELKTQDRSPNVYVGVAIDINNRTVELAPSTPVNKISEMGLELELPENLYLGKLGAGIDALVGQFSPDFKFKKYEEDTKDIPALQSIIKKVASAEITIQDLHIKIPPKPTAPKDGKGAPTKDPGDKVDPIKDPATLYTVALSATWSEAELKKDSEAELKAGNKPEKLAEGFNITLKGLYLMVTNETQEEIEIRRARAKVIQKKAQDAMLLEAAFNNSPASVNNGAAGETTNSEATAKASTGGRKGSSTSEPPATNPSV